MSSQLAPLVAWVTRSAELALLRRLDCGAGITTASQLFVRDAEALARVAGGTLRPSGSHRKAIAAVAPIVAARPADPHRVTLATLRMGLDDIDRDVLAVALAYALDLDAREYVHAIAARRRPGLYAETIAEIAAIPPERVLAALSPGAPLRRGRLVLVEGDGLAATVEIARPALAWLGGDDAIAAPLDALVEVIPADREIATRLPQATLDAAAAIGARALAYAVEQAGADRGSSTGALPAPVDRSLAAPIAAVIRGPRGSGRRAVAHAIARAAAGRPLFVVDVPRLVALEKRTRAFLVPNVVAAARLRDAIVYLHELDALYDDRGELPLETRDALATVPGLLLASTPGRGHVELHRPQLSLTMPRMELADRIAAWATAGLPAATADELGGRYVIGPGAIADVVAEAAAYARAAAQPLDVVALEAAVGRRLTVRLGSYGAVVHRKARFAELVLPDDVIDTMRDMVAMVRERSKILETWGYQRHLGISRGVSGLFSGEPGTGKTMAASVIASELGLELVRIDLSAVVSKYVGETEKNLGKIFDEAQDSHAMLLFDEADSLFGKRTELKSAQDRFANLEVNYILQRMETFDGVSVLTTNAEAAIDPALQRRLNFRVRFPDPEPDEREQLWRRLLPPGAGVHGDIDFAALAEKFDMTGGYIKNAVVRAAVIAARAGRGLTADDLWAGAHHEYVEMGKVMPQPVRR